MGRMDLRGSRTAEMSIPAFGGQNTAKTFSEIELSESPQMLNMIPKQIGGLANRPGSVPLTNAAVPNPIKALRNLRKNGVNTILASSGTALYKYASGVFASLTMTNTLNSADIDTAQFKDENSNEVLIIADGGALKYSDGIEVKNITPAADDASLPTNVLADLNTNHKPIGCVVHHTRVVVWDGTDRINHSKVGYYEYFPATDYQRWVRDNDYVITCLSYAGALLVLMRRHVGVLFGHDVGNWTQDFLDTNEGCMNAKTVQNVTFPDGRQEVFYLSDNGVNSVYTLATMSLDSSARYSTKSVTRNQIDWKALGVNNNEWARASASFYDGEYWLIYPKGSKWNGLVFNTIDSQWYPVDNVKANAFYYDENYHYFAGDDGHLKVFDKNLFSDYADAAKTQKTTINREWYSKLMTPKPTGYDHFWDVLMIEAKQHRATSTIDVEINTYNSRYVQVGVLKTEMFIIGVSKIGEAQISNPRLTEAVNNAKRLTPFLKGQYAQVKISNNRDEPIEILNLIFETRVMTKYS